MDLSDATWEPASMERITHVQVGDTIYSVDETGELVPIGNGDLIVKLTPDGGELVFMSPPSQ